MWIRSKTTSGKKTANGTDLAGNDYLTRAEAATILHALVNNLALPEKETAIEKYGVKVGIGLTYDGWLYLDHDPVPVRSTFGIALIPEDEAALEGREIEVSGTIIVQYGDIGYLRQDFTTERNGRSFKASIASDLLRDSSFAIVSVNVTIDGETFPFTEYVRVTHLA